jgi:hypothetical protein
MDVGTCDARYPELHVLVVSSSRLPLLSPPDAGHPCTSAGGHEAVSMGTGNRRARPHTTGQNRRWRPGTTGRVSPRRRVTVGEDDGSEELGQGSGRRRRRRRLPRYANASRWGSGERVGRSGKATQARPTASEPGNSSSRVSPGQAPSRVKTHRHTAAGLAPITRPGRVDRPGNLGGSDSWEDAGPWRHSGSTPRPRS